MKKFTIWQIVFAPGKYISFLKRTEKYWCSRIYLSVLATLIGVVSFGQTYKDNLAQLENINYQAQGVSGLEWVGSVLQSNNSSYSEGMSTLQRVILENLPATTNDIHTLRIRLQTQKDGKHAYDFITSWEQSMRVAQVIQTPGLISLPNPDAASYTADYDNLKCADAISSTAFNVCDAADYVVYLPISGEINLVLAGDLSTTSQVIAAYEAQYDPRTVKVKGNMPFSANPANNKVVFAGYDGVDMYYDITWQSSSTGIVIEFGAHIAAGYSPSGQYGAASPADGILGYGPMQGASNVSGAPYHVSFAGFQTNENKTMGSQDNQLMASGVKLIPFCDLDGPLSYCLGDTGNVFYNGNPTNVDGPQYAWLLTNNGTNATIVGSQTGPSLEVNPGTTAGSYTVKFTVTNDGGFYDVCEITTIVGQPLVSASNTGPFCLGANIALSATFTAAGSSASAVSWKWTGPDNFTSTMEDPTPFASTAAKAGEYTVEVTDNNGCKNTAKTTVVVNPLPSVSASNTGPYCLGANIGLSATFTAAGSSTSAVSWKWTGPDNFTSTMEDPTPFASTAAKAGEYTVEVTDNNGCKNTAKTTVVLNPLPTVSASNTGPYCLGSNIALSATFTAAGSSTSAVSWKWTGPDNFTSTMEDPTPFASTAAKAGEYTVEVTDNNGCKNTAKTTVVLNPLPTVSASNTGPYCLGSNIALSATFTAAGSSSSAVSWSWTGPDNFTSTMEDPTPFASSAAKAGEYTVEVTDNNGCKNTAKTTVVLNPLPTVSASNTGPYCLGANIALSATFTAAGSSSSAVSWKWTGPDNFTSTMEDPTPFASTAAKAGEYTVEVTDNNGCKNTVKTTVVLNPLPTVSASNTGPYCLGSNIALSATFTAAGSSTSAVSWKWTGPDNFTSTMEDPTPFASSAAKAGEYTVEVTDNNGCKNTAKTTVVLNPLPTVSASNTGPYCLGSNIALSATFTAAGSSTSAVSWKWTGPDNFTSTMEDPTPFASTAAKAGEYTVEVTDNNGCKNTAKTTVVLNPLPTVSASNTGPYCLGSNIALSATFTAAGSSSSAVSWSWTGPDNFTSTMEDPTLFIGNAAAAGEYTVTVTDNNGCVQTAKTIVVVQECITCETAFAMADGDPGKANCFIGDDVITSERWGWTNEFTGANGSFTETMTLYAGAGQCEDTAKGVAAGKVHISYDAVTKTVTVKYDMNASGYAMSSAHLYVGCDPYPKDKKGNATVSPGQFPFKSSSTGYFDKFEPDPIYVGSGTFYIIAHADVCTSANNANLEYYPQLTSNQQVQYLSASRNKPLSYVCGSVKNGGPASKIQSSDITEKPVVIESQEEEIVSESTVESSFSVSPVPFRESLIVQYDFDYVSNATIQMFDLQGRLLFTQQEANASKGKITDIGINFRILPSQIYVVKVTTDRDVFTKKIVSDK